MKNCVDTIRYGVCDDTHLDILKQLSDDEIAYLQSFLQDIPPPPSNSSPVTQNEIIHLYNLQLSKRSSMRDTIKVIDVELMQPFIALCSQLNIDPLLSKSDVCLQEGRKIALFYKAYFNRARPFQVSMLYCVDFAPMPSISALTPAYPSGHTIQSEMLCRMYSKYYPNYAKQFQSVADLISYSRVVGGLHYQSDIDVGKHIVDLMERR